MISQPLKVSSFAQEFNFDDIRPYYDHEVKEVVEQIIHDPMFMSLVHYLWPERTFEEVSEKCSNIRSNLDFQLAFMNDAIHRLVEMSATELTSSGFEHLDPKESYLFIANHRDILLDAALLQIMLVKHGFSTSEISFGSNLKQKGFVTDFGKLNRMFTVIREGNRKELYEISRKLSAYVRHTVIDKKSSVWIAQRNGRTKDGNDFTQSGLLKMLNISGEKNFVDNFDELRIVPLSISYEYEPCDILKTRELYILDKEKKYEKSPGEDMNSILTGIRQFKGRIHLAVSPPVRRSELMSFDKIENENEKIKALASELDKQIYTTYKCYAVNYIAADLIEGAGKRADRYSAEEKQSFEAYVEKCISKIEGEKPALKKIFLKMYAGPVFNKGE